MTQIVHHIFRVALGLSVCSAVAYANPELPKATEGNQRQSQLLEGVFLAADDALSLYFSLESGADGGHFRRRAEFVWTDDAGQFTRVYEDVAKGSPWQGAFPSPPAEMPIESLSDGSFLMSFPAPADWENRISTTPTGTSVGTDRPRVADKNSARLLIVAQFEGVAPQRGTHEAMLYGTRAKVNGTVWLRKEVGEENPAAQGESSSSWVVWRGPKNMRAQTLPSRSVGLAHHFVLGVKSECERNVPQSLLMTLPEPVRLVTSADPACFSSGKTVSRAAGVHLKDNAIAEVRGLVIWR